MIRYTHILWKDSHYLVNSDTVCKLWPLGQIWPPVSVNKVLLKQRHAQSNILYIATFIATNNSYVVPTETYPHNAKSIYFLSLYRKCLLTSVTGNTQNVLMHIRVKQTYKLPFMVLWDYILFQFCLLMGPFNFALKKKNTVGLHLLCNFLLAFFLKIRN